MGTVEVAYKVLYCSVGGRRVWGQGWENDVLGWLMGAMTRAQKGYSIAVRTPETGEQDSILTLFIGL